LNGPPGVVEPDANDSFAGDGRLLHASVRGLALGGGLLLVGVAALTVISVAGRYLFNVPIPGDYELTELACGVAVFAFFPYCHLRRGNIVVEFFTARLPARLNSALDAIHSLAFTAVALLLAWRLVVGGLSKMADSQTTIYLGVPLFWGYFLAVVGAAALCVVCAWVFVENLQSSRR